MKQCAQCRTEWPGINQPGSRDACTSCGADLHACRNCRFLDTAKSNQCAAGVEDPVINKERANFCDEFQFTDHAPGGVPKPGDRADEAREKFKKLFGG